MTDVRVKVADHAVSNGDAVLSTIGLGSCVAIALYDPSTRIGGLAHVLLPNEGMSRDRSNPAKFSTTAVPLLVAEMRRLGARGPIRAKIVGGSSMFASLIPSGGVNMGERNIKATREALRAHDIPLVAEDTGGEHGRSVYFDLRDGGILVRSLKAGDRRL